jgi:hypothetical protein
MKLIIRPIFLQPSGYWWAYSFIKPDTVYSLHTRDKAAAQAKYDKLLREMREAFKNDPID